MKTSKIFLMSAMVLSAFGLQSCLDYDTPSDEFQKETTVVTPPTISTGKADSINYNVEITEKMYQHAYKRLRSQLGTALTVSTASVAVRKVASLRLMHTSSSSALVRTTTFSTAAYLTRTSLTLTLS